MHGALIATAPPPGWEASAFHPTQAPTAFIDCSCITPGESVETKTFIRTRCGRRTHCFPYSQVRRACPAGRACRFASAACSARGPSAGPGISQPPDQAAGRVIGGGRRRYRLASSLQLRIPAIAAQARHLQARIGPACSSPATCQVAADNSCVQSINGCKRCNSQNYRQCRSFRPGFPIHRCPGRLERIGRIAYGLQPLRFRMARPALYPSLLI